MGKIRELLKRFLPISGQDFDQRISQLEDGLRSIFEKQNELTGKMERLLEVADKANMYHAETRTYATEGAHALDVWSRVQYPKLLAALDGLEGQVDRERGELVAMDNRVQEVIRDVAGCREILEALEHGVQNVTSGDVFRRIEFTQGKLVQLESLLQQNLLSRQAQRGSSEYQFILRMRALFPLLAVRSDKPFVRIGRHNDGGYVMLDDFEGRFAAYSIGIADDVSWDGDIATRGLDVFMYDHTIEGLPEENEQFHFSHIGICTKDDAGDSHFKTLPQMMADNGHLNTYGMILKIDVEGAEWAVLRELDEEVLKHFSQIVFEFHGLTDMKKEDDIRPAMEKLNKTHQLVHLHANNFGTYRLLGGAILPELLEGTYLLRSEYEFAGKPGSVSTELDEINCLYLADIHLGNWEV